MLTRKAKSIISNKLRNWKELKKVINHNKKKIYINKHFKK